MNETNELKNIIDRAEQLIAELDHILIDIKAHKDELTYQISLCDQQIDTLERN